MPEQETILRFSQQGANEVQTALTNMLQGLQQLTTAFSQFNKEAKPPPETQSAFKQFISQIQDLRQKFQEGQVAAAGFSGVMSVLSAGFKLAASPLGMLTLGLGSLMAVIWKTNESVITMYQELRQMAATTGMTIPQAENLKDTFALAGLSTDKLAFAMFKLSMALEAGGKEFTHLGIDIRDQNGAVKEAGQLFEEVRDKISSMGSRTEQAAAASEIFSARMARGMMPILTMTAAKYDELKQKAEAHIGWTDQLVGASQRLVEKHAELHERMEKLKLRMAEMITMPLEEKLYKVGEAMNRVSISFRIGGEAGADFMDKLTVKGTSMNTVFRTVGQTVGAMFFSKKQAQDIADMEDKAATAEGKAKRMQEEAVERAAKAADTKKRMLESEVKDKIEKGRMADTAEQDRLQSEQALMAEETKMRTGSDRAAISGRLEMNKRLVELVEERYRREHELAEERVFKSGGGKLTDAEENKLLSERNQALSKLNAESGKLRLDALKAEAAESARIMADEIKLMKLTSEERLSILESEKNRRLAVNELMLTDSVTKSMQRGQIEEDSATKIRDVKVKAIDDEIAKLREQMSKYGILYEERHRIEQQIMELQMQRTKAERSADDQIVASRRTMVQELQSLANQEAGIGDSLANKALESLKKRGRRTASESDIVAEADRLRMKGAAALSGGGKIEDIQNALGMRGTFAQMAQMGSSTGGAIGQLFNQANAAFAGSNQQFMPSNMRGGVPSIASMVDSQNLKKTLADDIADGAREGAKRGADDLVAAFREASGSIKQMMADAVTPPGGLPGAGGPQGVPTTGTGYDSAAWRRRWNPTGADEPEMSELTIEIARQLGREAKRAG